MAHDVFISHSVKDKTIADAMCAMFESEGIRCWIAPRDVTPGMEWGKCIIDAIRHARIMVLVFTANANASQQIRREVERAVHHDVIIVPFRVENIVPDESLEYFIGNVHWVDALTPPLENHLKKLTSTIKALLEQVQSREERAGPQPSEAERELQEKAEREAVARSERERQEQAEREAAVKAERERQEQAEREAAAKIERERREQAERVATPASAPVPEAPVLPSAPESHPGPKRRGVPLWAWSGAILLALVLVVFFAVRSGTNPPPASSAPQAAPYEAPSPKPDQAPTGSPAATSATPQELAEEAQAFIQQGRDAKAKPLAEQACDGGSMYGCERLGMLYELGTGVSHDYAQAASLYRKSCDGGLAEGCEYLGSVYDDGKGVAQDYAQGASLYRRACEGGDIYGCYRLGMDYEFGKGVAQDYARAAPLYRKTCDGGDDYGCDRLGDLYESGKGVPQDIAQARTLFQKACNRGFHPSCDELKKLQE
jgi:hypothetical protein